MKYFQQNYPSLKYVILNLIYLNISQTLESDISDKVS